MQFLQLSARIAGNLKVMLAKIPHVTIALHIAAYRKPEATSDVISATALEDVGLDGCSVSNSYRLIRPAHFVSNKERATDYAVSDAKRICFSVSLKAS